MEMHELLSPNAIVDGLKVGSKKQTLQALSAKAAELTGLEERDIFSVVLERERLGTTGVGQGLAIPHGKLPGLEQITGIFARLAKPVDFDAIDREPVDLVFMLIAPESAGAEHLKALARVSRLFRNPMTCEKLRGSADASALYALMASQKTAAA
ncbi:MAG: PTS IIA-like nitrogen regulatory protein PtsN [Pseudomonadota bacterium]